jgi:hypothetical protein
MRMLTPGPLHYVALESLESSKLCDKEVFRGQLTALLTARGFDVTMVWCNTNSWRAPAYVDDTLAPFEGAALVTLRLGSNDLTRARSGRPDSVFADGYARRCRAFFEVIARKCPNAVVLVLPQHDWSRSPNAEMWGGERHIRREIGQYNAILARETQAAGAHWLALSALFQEQARQGMFLPASIDASAQAHHEWAQAACAALCPT